MLRRIRTSRVFFLKATTIGLAAIFCWAGCGGGSEDGEKKTVIGFMPKLVGIEYFRACEKGAKEAAAELGVELFYDGPIENSVSRQVEMTDTWILREMDAICIAPNDPDSISPVLKKAQGRGIHVVAYDADAQPDARKYFVNQATYSGIAESLVDVMAEGIGGEGEIAIITGSLTAKNQNMWIDLMRTYMAEKYPNMKEVDFRGSEEDQQVAHKVALDLMKAHPNLKGIFGMTSVALPGAGGAVQQAEKIGKVFVTGLSTPNGVRQYVKTGAIEKFVLWDAVDLGYLTVQVATAMVRGQIPDDAEIFPAGRLGNVEIRGDEILLGAPLVFSAENIDQYQF